MKKFGICCGLLAAWLCLSCLPAFAQDEEGAKRKLDIKPSVRGTVFAGPVREDGTIDYVAALDAHYRKGVTKDNNAYRGLFMLTQRKPDGEDWEHDEYEAKRQALEITPAELDAAPHFISWHDHAEAFGHDEGALYDIEAEALLGPIDSDILRDYEKWVQKSEPCFEFAAQTVSKSAYWMPVTSDEPGLVVAVMLPSLGEHRALARGLQAWVYQSAKQGDFDKTLGGIKTLRLLAWHQSKDWSLISSLVSISIDALTMQTIQRLIEHRLLPADKLAELDVLLRGRAPRVPLAESIGIGETCMGLDAFMQILAGRVGVDELMGGGGADDGPMGKILASGAFDVNRGLRQLRMQYLQMYRIAKIEDYAMRQRLTAQFEEQFENGTLQEDLFVQVGDARVPNPALLVSVEKRTDALADLFTTIMFPALGAATNTETRFMAGERCTFTAIAVERYRLKHGKLPASLGDLVPEYLDALELDTFANEPLRYKITEKGFMVYSVNDNMVDDGGVDDRDREDNDWVITIDYKDKS